ncbi:baseplate J/gp47 family protein [Paenibacillus sp. GCM10027626]|uniref:baseplate J/gp47 family protein n=1 Tax=Paenibacillus sp. GCM10027626 TaxID=3273411 RepID=UPI00362FBFDA
MYEHQTYETILQRMLNRVPDNVDKREGAIIYDALAPAAMEMAIMYAALDTDLSLSFADTATGEYLSRRTAEFGINRHSATKARRLGRFYNSGGEFVAIPTGSRFGIEGVVYTALAKQSAGNYVLECEAPGEIGNQKSGDLLPVDYVTGLARAELADVLVPGADEETDEALRQRYFTALNEQPFGGNIADYRTKIGSIAGVGGVKVAPAWQGGGTVRCILIANDFNVPSATLIENVQEAIDPAPQGKGLGQAPIGHTVTISGVAAVTINVETTLTLAAGMTIGQVQSDVEAAIGEYMLMLRRSWAAETELVARISQIEARILTVPGIADVTGTKLNGSTGNVTLQAEEIPLPGTVILHD